MVEQNSNPIKVNYWQNKIQIQQNKRFGGIKPKPDMVGRIKFKSNKIKVGGIKFKFNKKNNWLDKIQTRHGWWEKIQTQQNKQSVG